MYSLVSSTDTGIIEYGVRMLQYWSVISDECLDNNLSIMKAGSGVGGIISLSKVMVKGLCPVRRQYNIEICAALHNWRIARIY